jgi:type I restriction enzyme S subunit
VPDVPLRPSGVEWLGDVPAHWDVVRGKRLFWPRKQLAQPGDQQLSATQAYGVIAQSDFEERVGRRVVKISMHLEQRRHVERDDFVISMRSFQGGLERAWTSGAIRSSYVVLKPSSSVDVDFFSYVLKSPGYIRALQATADFIRDGQDLNFGNFAGVDLPLPPLAEQRSIATFIAGATASIDSAVAGTQREIALTQEFRSRMAADVVTGKLDIRRIAAALPEVVDEAELPESHLGDDDERDVPDDTIEPIE